MELSSYYIIEKLSVFDEIKYIIRSNLKVGKDERPILLILLGESSNDVIQNIITTIKQFPDPLQEIVFRYYSIGYAETQISSNNLFFLETCQPDNLIFKRENESLPFIEEPIGIDKIKHGLDKEISRIKSFQKGADFYIKQKNPSQATFMLHQVFELAFRLVEIQIMGKELVCHKISEHQKYVRDFIPELSNLFSDQIPGEIQLLSILDKAYIEARYERDFTIKAEELRGILEKCDYFIKAVKTLIFLKIKELVQEEILNGEEYIPEEKVAIENPDKLKERLKNYSRRKLKKHRKGADKLFYKTEFTIMGPADILYTIAGILKTCIIALDSADTSYSRLIPQPHVNIQTALEQVCQLLPYEEMHCLEDILKEFPELIDAEI